MLGLCLLVSQESVRGSQGASRAAPGKSGLHARGEGERVLALESREGTRASRRLGLPVCSFPHCLLQARIRACEADL